MNSLLKTRVPFNGGSYFTLSLFLAIGWFTVTFLANESPPSQSPFVAVLWALFVSTVVSTGFIAVWIVVGFVSNRLMQLVLPVYVTFAFYSYIQGFANDSFSFDFIRNRLFYSDRVFVPLLVLLTIVVFLLINRFVKWNDTFARYAVIVVLFLGLWNFALWGFGQTESFSFDGERSTSDAVLMPPAEQFPIFWLLFDGYARADVLTEHYGFDNSTFLNQLESQGFDVDYEATSNFISTGFVIPSMMELENFGTIGESSVNALAADRDPSDWRFEESALAILLSDIGYTSIEHSSERPTSIGTRVFSVSFYETTGLKAIPPSLQWWRHANGTGGVGLIDNLAATSAHAGEQDVVVFSYNYQPHPPYFFDAAGPKPGSQLAQPTFKTRREEWYKKDEFVGQTEFVNARILEAVEEIIENSSVDPLIIIQSDHGPASSWIDGKLSDTPSEELFYERTAILSAVHLPASCDKNEYAKSNSSLNTFSLVLNSCFGTDVALHPDDVYWGDPGRFTVYEDGVWSPE